MRSSFTWSFMLTLRIMVGVWMLVVSTELTCRWSAARYVCRLAMYLFYLTLTQIDFFTFSLYHYHPHSWFCIIILQLLMVMNNRIWNCHYPGNAHRKGSNELYYRERCSGNTTKSSKHICLIIHRVQTLNLNSIQSIMKEWCDWQRLATIEWNCGEDEVRATLPWQWGLIRKWWCQYIITDNS
jgi:hypothetical protein